MSFYGEQPKLSEYNLTFDAYYPSRTILDTNENELAIGSRILISYYIDNDSPLSDGISLSEQFYPGRADLNNSEEINQVYQDNLSKDLTRYHNSYHNTVWQKVAFNNITSYIMIAELNSIVPQLNIDILPSVSITTMDSTQKNRLTYLVDYTKQSGNENDDYTLMDLISYLNGLTDEQKKDPHFILKKENGQPAVKPIYYNLPKVNLDESSEVGYKIELPSIPNFLPFLNDYNKNSEYNDTIYLAYDDKTDTYVLNMSLGHLESYLEKMKNEIVVDATKMNEYWDQVGQNPIND